MTSSSVSASVAEWAARAAWIAPTAALFVIGFSERAEALLGLARIAPAELVVPCGLAALTGLVAGGLALYARRAAGMTADARNRRALAGVGVSALVIALIAIASQSGAASGRKAEAALRRAVDAAMRDYPGWNGGAVLDGATVHASEVPEGSELATMLVRPYKRPLRIVLFGVDNRAGRRAIELDRDGATLRHAGGASTPAVTRAELLGRVETEERAGVDESLANVHVPPGARVDGIPLFFPGTASFRDVERIEVRVGGEARELPGRYFTLKEKRAIDAARGRAR